jgi:hypothetical protein
MSYATDIMLPSPQQPVQRDPLHAWHREELLPFLRFAFASQTAPAYDFKPHILVAQDCITRGKAAREPYPFEDLDFERVYIAVLYKHGCNDEWALGLTKYVNQLLIYLIWKAQKEGPYKMLGRTDIPSKAFMEKRRAVGMPEKILFEYPDPNHSCQAQGYNLPYPIIHKHLESTPSVSSPVPPPLRPSSSQTPLLRSTSPPIDPYILWLTRTQRFSVYDTPELRARRLMPPPIIPASLARELVDTTKRYIRPPWPCGKQDGYRWQPGAVFTIHLGRLMERTQREQEGRAEAAAIWRDRMPGSSQDKDGHEAEVEDLERAGVMKEGI